MQSGESLYTPITMDDATILPSNRPSDDANVHSVGDLIDNRYTVIRELGRGGMGVVYEVDDTLVSERLALKRLLPSQLDPDSVTAFIQAGNASRKFSGRSKRFVSTHTLGKDAFGPYLVLELVTAPTLRSLIQDGNIASLDLAMTILRDIAQGLADLHEEGYVHRDVKPDNIFVQDGGKVLLADFGISKDMASSAGTMLPGALSRNYGSPEQAKGLPTTQASDIYAFGAVAFELFSGDAPYGAIEPLTELVPGIDQGLSDLVMRCLAQRPERRPQNGADLLAALSVNPESTETLQKEFPVQPPAKFSYETQISPAPKNSTVPTVPSAIKQDVSIDLTPKRWQDQYPDLANYLFGLVPIPGGDFWLGGNEYEFPISFQSPDGRGKIEGDLLDDTRPRRRVRLSPFFLGSTPVTVEVWREYCNSTGRKMPPQPKWGWIDGHPIVNVSWIDVMGDGNSAGFCGWASDVTGFDLTLPTEAQWEYAAAGGDTCQYYPWGGHEYYDSMAWTSLEETRTSTAPVNRTQNVHRNIFGLSDMAGNVCEWCSDFRGPYDQIYGTKPEPSQSVGMAVEIIDPVGVRTGTDRVLRGGAWNLDFGPDITCVCRNAERQDNFRSDEEDDGSIGFRLCRLVPEHVRSCVGTKTTKSLRIVDVGSQKSRLIKFVMDYLGISYADAKKMLDMQPTELVTNCSSDIAEMLRLRLDIIGVTSELIDNPDLPPDAYVRPAIQAIVPATNPNVNNGFDIVLIDAGNKKIKIIKTVRELTGLGLREAKDLVDYVPSKVKQNVTRDEALKLRTLLESDGATVEFVPPMEPAIHNVTTSSNKGHASMGNHVTPVKPLQSSTSQSKEVISNAPKRWQDRYPALAQYMADLRVIPGGQFWMGAHDGDVEPSEDVDDEVADFLSDAKPVHRVALSAFRLGATPVTVAMWQEYSNAAQIKMPEPPEWGWLYDHPMVNVSYDEIMGDGSSAGFCRWVTEITGVRVSLPTEAQWEYAAAGGDTGYKFPNGNQLENALYWEGMSTAEVNRVDCIFRNSFGLSDMCGNVSHWCLDYYGQYPLEEVKNVQQIIMDVPAPGLAGLLGKTVQQVHQNVSSLYVSPSLLTNPSGPVNGEERCCRGGGFWSLSERGIMRCQYRRSHLSYDADHDIGFRLSAGPG